MILAVSVTPSNLAAAVILGGACMLFVALAAGRFLAMSHGSDDDECENPMPADVFDARDAYAPGPVRLYDRNHYLVEALTRTPGESHAHASSRPRRHDGDCRPRSVHPAI